MVGGWFALFPIATLRVTRHLPPANRWVKMINQWQTRRVRLGVRPPITAVNCNCRHTSWRNGRPVVPIGIQRSAASIDEALHDTQEQRLFCGEARVDPGSGPRHNRRVHPVGELLENRSLLSGSMPIVAGGHIGSPGTTASEISITNSLAMNAGARQLGLGLALSHGSWCGVERFHVQCQWCRHQLGGRRVCGRDVRPHGRRYQFQRAKVHNQHGRRHLRGEIRPRAGGAGSPGSHRDHRVWTPLATGSWSTVWDTSTSSAE